MKYIILISFIILNALVYYATAINLEQRIETSEQTQLHRLQVDYEVFMIHQSNNADVIFANIVNTDQVKTILTDAWLSKDKKRMDADRAKLQKLLHSTYEQAKQNGVLHFQFVLPNNISFLRMHKPSKYGDSLNNIRLDFEKVHTRHKIIRGFSQGRTSHGFRNVYPLFDANKNYIAAVEISYPTELLQQSLNKISEIHAHFIVNKNIFEVKAWSRNDSLVQYQQSYENDDYYFNLSDQHKRLEKNQYHEQRLSKIKKEIAAKMKQARMFSYLSVYKNEYQLISFLPIYQTGSKQIPAWIVSYENDKNIAIAARDTLIVRVTSFVIFFLIAYFIFRIVKQNNKLHELVDAYDKNVIFSTTDPNGIITHASKAFCEISGYTTKELIGKPHNIIRHPDMPKSAFQDMWQTIQSGKSWYGEIKNRKKNGGFYWTSSEVEPVFKDNKIVSYIAVRHDITAIKEIEYIQREIIFTMGAVGENRSKETGNHVKRVALYSKLFATLYGLNEEEATMLQEASPMHDIGKVAIPDSILNKPGRLDDDEMQIMKTHAQKGYEMLQYSERPLLKTAAIVAYEHHEKWNGGGYPNGTSGEDIHIYGRITAIADVFDALGSDRCYKKAWDDEKIFQLLKDESGKHFDPKLVDIFFKNLNQFLEIREKFQDKF